MALIGIKRAYFLFLGLFCLLFAHDSLGFSVHDVRLRGGLSNILILYHPKVEIKVMEEYIERARDASREIYNNRQQALINSKMHYASTYTEEPLINVEYIVSDHIKAAVVTAQSDIEYFFDVFPDVVLAVEHNKVIRELGDEYRLEDCCKHNKSPNHHKKKKQNPPPGTYGEDHYVQLLEEMFEGKIRPFDSPDDPKYCKSPEALWGQRMVSCDGDKCGDVNFVPKSLGEGVYIFMVDSGVNDNGEFGSRLKDPLSLLSKDKSTSDILGHGTMTAGLAASKTYGIARKANIVPIKVVGGLAQIELATLLRAMAEISNYRKRKGIKNLSVANFSLGVPVSHLMTEAIKQLYYSGVIVIVSAGNSAEDACEFSPAGDPKSLTVGSINKNFEISYFSNYGPCVDLFAPGEQVVSACSRMNCACNLGSGTSFSAPIVAGIAAVAISENPTLPEDKIRKLIIDTSRTNVIKSVRPLTTFRLATTNFLAKKT